MDATTARALLLLAVWAGNASGQTRECKLLCAPTLKLEPSISISNLFGGAAVAEMGADGVVEVGRAEREAEFEVILALGVPTSIPRIGLTLEASWKPFARTDAKPFTGATAGELGAEHVRDNVAPLHP